MLENEFAKAECIITEHAVFVIVKVKLFEILDEQTQQFISKERKMIFRIDPDQASFLKNQSLMM
jgi:hypothetical protein